MSMLQVRASTPALRAILSRRTRIVSPRQFKRKLTQNSSQGGSYASTGHRDHGKKSSDMPWLIGALVISVPSAFYLLYSSPNEKLASHHGPAHHPAPANDSTPGEEEGASSGEQTAKPQTDAASEPASEAIEDVRGQAKEKFGDIEGKAGELYGGAKDKAKTGVADKAVSVKAKAGETFENMSEEFKGKAHGEDTDSRKDTGRPNPDGAKKGPVDASKRMKVEETGGGSLKTSDNLSDLNKKSDKNLLQTDPPAAGMKGPSSTNEMNGGQEVLSNCRDVVLFDERGVVISEKPGGSHETAKPEGTTDPNRPIK